MADFITTETGVLQLSGGAKPLLLVNGTYISSAGATGGVIVPGYTTSGGAYTAISGSQAVGARKVLGYVFTPTLADINCVTAALSYDTTLDRDFVTITTEADTGGTFSIICEDAGS
jgi:hypothetical protein